MQHFFHTRLNVNELLFSSCCHLFFELQFHRIEQMKENEMIYIATFNVLAGLCPPPHQSAHQPQLFDVVGFPCSCKVSNSVFPIISKSFKRLFEMTDNIVTFTFLASVYNISYRCNNRSIPLGLASNSPHSKFHTNQVHFQLH